MLIRLQHPWRLRKLRLGFVQILGQRIISRSGNIAQLLAKVTVVPDVQRHIVVVDGIVTCQSQRV